MMTDNNHQQRRRVYINKDFQLRYVIRVLLIVLLSGVGSVVLAYLIMADDIQAQAFSAHVDIAQASERLGVAMMIGNLVAMIVAGLIAVISVLHGSHKLAGPLYRFEVLCQQIADGNLDDLPKLRETDQLHELAHAFSTMVVNLRHQRQLHSELVVSLGSQLNSLQDSQTLTQDQRETIASMRESLKRLESQMNLESTISRAG